MSNMVQKALVPAFLILTQYLWVNAEDTPAGGVDASSSQGSRTSRMAPGAWTLVGWNDLGMHCMDGSDYSLFSVLPPFNNIYAHLVHLGKLVTNTTGITVTYHAIYDPDGSINTSSKDKINFWQYCPSLFGVTLPGDTGLAGFAMPGASNTPQVMGFTNGYYSAPGVPSSVFDDATNKNYYPMMSLTAWQGTTMLATTAIVLPVSDEMDCRACHGSGSNTNALPVAGWAWNPVRERDVKLNVMQIHDQKNQGSDLYTNALALAGYRPEGLLATATNGTPILCARCHKSNALPGTGLPGICDFTQGVHMHHAMVIDPATGMTLDDATSRTACYRCHPGSATRCLRGAMGRAIAPDGSMQIACQNCHGPMSEVGRVDRQGWLDEPQCQSCHTGPATHNNGQIRFTTAFEISNQVRLAVDQLFASNSNTPGPGQSLYKLSRGHGKQLCETCHGSTHAEYPSLKLSDNIQCIALQGQPGKIGDCTICHGASPTVITNGPHGLHLLGLTWIQIHHDYAATNKPGRDHCFECHGTDARGTVLSRVLTDRTVVADPFGTNHFWQGQQISCYICHNGPNESAPTTNTPPVTYGVAAMTTASVPVSVMLQASDVNPQALTMHIVSQPTHGSIALAGSNATYIASPTFVGRDIFTYAAWDSVADSNLGTGTIDVVQGECAIALSATVPPTTTVGDPTPFWSAATVSGVSNAISYVWSFYDGTSNETQQYTSHSYTSNGWHLWSVTASAAGTNATQSDSIFVTPEPTSMAFAALLCAIIRRRRKR